MLWFPVICAGVLLIVLCVALFDFILCFDLGCRCYLGIGVGCMLCVGDCGYVGIVFGVVFVTL